MTTDEVLDILKDGDTVILREYGNCYPFKFVKSIMQIVPNNEAYVIERINLEAIENYEIEKIERTSTIYQREA